MDLSDFATLHMSAIIAVYHQVDDDFICVIECLLSPEEKKEGENQVCAAERIRHREGITPLPRSTFHYYLFIIYTLMNVSKRRLCRRTLSRRERTDTRLGKAPRYDSV